MTLTDEISIEYESSSEHETDYTGESITEHTSELIEYIGYDYYMESDSVSKKLEVTNGLLFLLVVGLASTGVLYLIYRVIRFFV